MLYVKKKKKKKLHAKQELFQSRPRRHLVCLNFLLIVGLMLTSEKAMAPHSSTLVWKTPWMEEPGRLQSMGSLRVG